MVETEEEVLAHSDHVDDARTTQVNSRQSRVPQITVRYELADQR